MGNQERRSQTHDHHFNFNIEWKVIICLKLYLLSHLKFDSPTIYVSFTVSLEMLDIQMNTLTKLNYQSFKVTTLNNFDCNSIAIKK